jgi:hypothetical protein
VNIKEVKKDSGVIDGIQYSLKNSFLDINIAKVKNEFKMLYYYRILSKSIT